MPSYKKSLLIKSLIYFGMFLLLLALVYVPRLGLCPYYVCFGKECPACGATRCLFALMRLDFIKAIGLNPVFALGIYPVMSLTLGFDYVMTVVNFIKRQEKQTLLGFFSNF